MCILGRKTTASRADGVDGEHTAALMGIAVQPDARSDTDSDSMKSVVRSSRKSGYDAITAITNEFMMMFSVITAPMIVGFTSLIFGGSIA